MSPHFWIEIRSVKKITLFVVAVVLIAVFWFVLPAEIKEVAFRRYRRGVASLPVMMFIGWVGGWFLLLFVRGEDLHVTAPFDFQALSHVIAVAMICASLVIAGFLSLSFFS